MAKVRIRNDQWRKIVAFLSENPKVYLGQEKQCRRGAEAVTWIMKSGAQWRLLPEQYGNWNSVYKRYNRWSNRGVWQEMFEHFIDDPDMESVMMDSSVIRAHACTHAMRCLESTRAEALLAGSQPDSVLADTAYDAERILVFVSELGAEAVIPPRSNRKQLRDYDKELYKERHLIECFIGKLKHFRRCFSRFDKLARNYLSFLHFASALIWLR